MTVILIIFTSVCFSQSQKDSNLTSLSRVNLGLHGLGFSYELPISNKFIWENGFGFGMGSSVYRNTVSYVFDIARPTPYLKSELKYIYNTKKRISKEKSILNNSGNYVGFQAKYSFGNKNHSKLNSTLLTEIHWGMQRDLGKKFIFNTHIGIGYLKDFHSEYSSLTPVIGLRFGYKIF